MTYVSGDEIETGDLSPRERVVVLTRRTGVLPCIKLREQADYLAYARAMVEGGARLIEVTMTTPKALEAIEAISSTFGNDLYVAAGTVLDAPTAREVILVGGQLIVSPVFLPEVVDMAHRYNVACYPGVFTATECLAAMRAGADMLKIFPAQIGGPKYMTNLAHGCPGRASGSVWRCERGQRGRLHSCRCMRGLRGADLYESGDDRSGGRGLDHNAGRSLHRDRAQGEGDPTALTVSRCG